MLTNTHKMNIPHQIITLCEKSSYHYGGYYNQTFISSSDIAIIAIISLHIKGKINDSRLNALFAQYRNGTLIRKVNTYHCRINDEWYSDDSTFTAFLDSYNQYCKPLFDLSDETVLKYFSKLLNKKRNYCIDHLYFTYVQPLLSQIDSSEIVQKVFAGMNIPNCEFITYEKANRNSDLESGYCCSDCSGCLGEYKRSRYRYLYNYQTKDVEVKVKAYFDSLKTDSALFNVKNKTQS